MQNHLSKKEQATLLMQKKNASHAYPACHTASARPHTPLTINQARFESHTLQTPSKPPRTMVVLTTKAFYRLLPISRLNIIQKFIKYHQENESSDLKTKLIKVIKNSV